MALKAREACALSAKTLEIGVGGVRSGDRLTLGSTEHQEVGEWEQHSALWGLLGGPCISAQRVIEGGGS